jgi:hypothetical protein
LFPHLSWSLFLQNVCPLLLHSAFPKTFMKFLKIELNIKMQLKAHCSCGESNFVIFCIWQGEQTLNNNLCDLGLA